MHVPNHSVEGTRHVMPTLDDLILDLNGAQIFSKLDLKAGYHQLELDEESRQITFSTHVGIHRYKRLFFGINCASEIFQNTISQVIDGILGVKNISDDIIVCRTSTAEHDRRLDLLLCRLVEKGLTVNSNKCEFNKTSVEYYGHVFSRNGILPSPAKVEAVRQAGTPSNPDEVRSLLGLAQYTARFIPNFATLMEPLHDLTKQDTHWQRVREKAMLSVT